MAWLKWTLFALVLLCLAIFIWQFQTANTELVVVRTLIGDLSAVQLGNAILWSLLVGFLSGLLVGLVFWQLKVIENLRLRRKIREKLAALSKQTKRIAELKADFNGNNHKNNKREVLE